MNRIIRKFGILFAIFVAALLLYFFGNRRLMHQDETVYTAMEDASLPIVTVDMDGREMNRMPGYLQDMGNSASADCLTILPEDRQLPVHITGRADAVLGIRYEIRSLDLERLVENTELESWEAGEDGIRVLLPIQNLLTEGREYQLRLELVTEQHGPVYYYTRILLTEGSAAQDMINLAVSFSEKTFDYDQARDLVTYLETSPEEDNSSFGHTGIHSSFAQLTWGKTGMQPAGPVQVTLRELDGIMSCVQLSYLASRQGESGNQELYEVEENFTMKWNELRTYLMDYERTVNQIFQGEQADYSGKRIMLGITNDEEVEVKRSPDKSVYAYRVNRDLWSFQPGSRDSQAVRVFSFRGSEESDVREQYGQHDIRLLQVDDEGNIDFLVYGYMNRGNHEGRMGITGYHYDASGNALEELFFIPSRAAFEELEADLEQLAYQTEGDMLYLLVDHAIYGIDLKSRENMVVADALEEGSYAISTDRRRIAWQEGGSRYEASSLSLMDLETGEKQVIHGGADEYVRALGFVGSDLVYGIAREGDLWVINGRIEDLPMYAVKIVNDRLQEETSYEKHGYYVSDVHVEESRIHINRVTRLGGQQYAAAQEDTIVCNVDMGPGAMEGIGWYASQDRGKLYFVQLDSELKSGRSVHRTAPKKLTFAEADMLELESNNQVQTMQFYAYGGGHLLEVTSDFSEALQLAYEKMGLVKDRNHQVLWNRVNRGGLRTIREPLAAAASITQHLGEFTASRTFGDGVTLVDARGCSMMQLLYFIDRGIPVMAYTGEGSYLLLIGFDQYNVTVYDPATGETYKAGLNDSTEYFRVRGNDFICAVSSR
ncbi:MAG: hypothetical protein Q4F28_12805 [Eubacteriales bacterium]|nr:hypothetical protein [Eubacteriales bacterium]